MSDVLTGPRSTVPGYASVPFDLGKALAILHMFEHDGCQYGLDCKPVDYPASPPVCRDYSGRYGGGTVDRIDCSGLFKYVLLHAAGLEVPDGSVNQNDFLGAHGFKRHDTAGPSDAQYLRGLDRGCVYACFCRAGDRGEAIGHVWLVAWVNGAWWTIESHGGAGPSSRPYDTPVLAHIVTQFYPIARARR